EMSLDDALRECLVLLDIAADLDAATGGYAKVLPVAKAITPDGILEIAAERMQAVGGQVTADRENAGLVNHGLYAVRLEAGGQPADRVHRGADPRWQPCGGAQPAGGPAAGHRPPDAAEDLRDLRPDHVLGHRQPVRPGDGPQRRHRLRASGRVPAESG